MRRIRHLIARGLDLAVTLIMMALVLDVVWGILSRLCNISNRWSEEVAVFLLMWLSLLGAAAAFERCEHLGVDYLVVKLHPSVRRKLHIAVGLCVLAFVVSVLIIGGGQLVAKALASGQLTAATQIPMGYVYLAVPLSGLLFALFAVEQAFSSTTKVVDTDVPMNAE